MAELLDPDVRYLAPPLARLAEVCSEEGWRLAIIDRHSRQLVRIERGERFFFAGIGRIHNFPLNASVATSIARDKAFTYATVAAAGIAVPDHGYFFLDPGQAALRGPGRERRDAFAYAHARGYPVFVKPIDGSKGARADIAYGEEDLAPLLDHVASDHHAALLQPVFDGEDRRLFLFEGALMFGYRRLRPRLVGRAGVTLRTLLAEANATALAKGVTPVPETSPFLRRALSARGLTLEDALAPGEDLVYAARANLSAGGTITDYSEDAPQAWIDWARAIVAALGLAVAAVDFFRRIDAEGRETLTLVEVNGNPSFAGPLTLGHGGRVKEIWRRTGRRAFGLADGSAA